MICPSIRFPSQPRISRPVDVQHTTHVSYNPMTRQYLGLPSEWRTELNRQFGHDPRNVESEKLPEYEAGIPTVLLKMKRFLLDNSGLQTEGIFRTAPGPSVCDQAKEVLDSGNIIGMDVDVVVIANLIKIYFRELPTPILPFELREEISRCQTIADCNAIVGCLTEPFRSLLQWLLDLAALFAFFQCENKMTSRNFSIILAPNLFSVPPEFNSLSTLYLSQRVAAFLEQLIEDRTQQMRHPQISIY